MVNDRRGRRDKGPTRHPTLGQICLNIDEHTKYRGHGATNDYRTIDCHMKQRQWT